MPLSSLSGVRGSWETDNENVLTLDPALGIGKVRAVGNVVVKHHLASVYTFVDLEALPVSSVRYSNYLFLLLFIHLLNGKVGPVHKDSVWEWRESSTHSRLGSSVSIS